VPSEPGDAAGRRIGFQHTFTHGLAKSRGGELQGGFCVVDLFAGDGSLNLFDEVFDRAEGSAVAALAFFRLAGSTDRRLMDDWHSKLL
jgi:hypothetical protein